MIIECINCGKYFKVSSDLIPINGRLLRCASCDHIWHFKRENSQIIQTHKDIQNNQNDLLLDKNDIEDNKSSSSLKTKKLLQNIEVNENQKINEKLELTNKGSNKKINNFFSYLLVIIISFLALIILVDTLKSPLINFFPGLEIVLFSLFETIKDIKLFIIDLT